MKKHFTFFYVALIVATLSFVACNKDSDGGGKPGGGGGGGGDTNGLTITATGVKNSSGAIKTVRAYAWWETDVDDGVDIIAEAPYQNNGFSLKLPATLANKYLWELGGLEYIFNVSDKNAKMLFFDEIYGCDIDNDEIGDFWCTSDWSNGEDYAVHYTSWIYVDRNVTIKGELKDSYYDDYELIEYESIQKLDLNLNKGWNVVYDSYTGIYDDPLRKYTETYSLTTQKPSGVNYQWYFEEYGDWWKSAQSKKSSLKSPFKNKKR